jgi:hypothetical protein
MEAMMLSIAEPGGTIYLASIQDAILKSGVKNYEINWITVDYVGQPIADLSFTGYEYPLYTSIQFYSF